MSRRFGSGNSISRRSNGTPTSWTAESKSNLEVGDGRGPSLARIVVIGCFLKIRNCEFGILQNYRNRKSSNNSASNSVSVQIPTILTTQTKSQFHRNHLRPASSPSSSPSITLMEWMPCFHLSYCISLRECPVFSGTYLLRNVEGCRRLDSTPRSSPE